MVECLRACTTRRCGGGEYDERRREKRRECKDEGRKRTTVSSSDPSLSTYAAGSLRAPQLISCSHSRLPVCSLACAPPTPGTGACRKKRNAELSASGRVREAQQEEGDHAGSLNHQSWIAAAACFLRPARFFSFAGMARLETVQSVLGLGAWAARDCVQGELGGGERREQQRGRKKSPQGAEMRETEARGKRRRTPGGEHKEEHRVRGGCARRGDASDDTAFRSALASQRQLQRRLCTVYLGFP